MSNSSSRRRNPRRGGKRGKARAPAEAIADVTIDGLGAGGDGVGVWHDAPLYAAGLLPGERARLRIAERRGAGRVGHLEELLEPSPDRTAPPCPYAETCGGCSLQHLADAPYAAWKDSLLDRALATRGLTPESRLPLLRVGEGRRRLRMAAVGRSAGVALGFNGKSSRMIVDIDHCLAAVPGLAEAPGLIRPLADAILAAGETADFDVRWAKAGLDLLIVRERSFDLDERRKLAEFAEANGFARISWTPDDSEPPEIVAERAAPVFNFGRLGATPPPGAFLQPTAEGEAQMAAFVAERLAGAKRIADLYAGWGAFALRLADPAHVQAFEGNAAMVQSLNRARAASGLGGFVDGHVRDLARQPLLAPDLKSFDALVLDPPRSGAEIQTAQLAKAGPARIVYLSCNPASFARDAAALVAGGYRFLEVMPIDQFRWTPHLEVASYFER